MTRHPIGLLLTLALVILVAPVAAEAQPPATHVHRIGVLSSRSPLVARPYVEAFRQRLRALGYVEGQNLALDDRYAEGQAERLPELAAALVRLQVEVLVAAGAQAIHAAQHATRTIPIVMAGTADPVAAGFVASLAHPGGEHHGLERPERGVARDAPGDPQGGGAPERAHRRAGGPGCPLPRR